MKRIMLVDERQGTYIFLGTGEIYINGEMVGKGRLKVNSVRLLECAEFTVNDKTWKTFPLVGALIREDAH